MDGINRTLYIPLYGRAKVSKMGIILNDKSAEEIWEKNPVPLGKQSKSRWLTYFMAMRARQFDDWAKMQLADHPDAIVLHIGCGLDSRVKRVNGHNHPWYDIDFPDVIAERRRFFAGSGEYRMLPGDVSSLEWLSGIDYCGTAVIIMEGVSMYLAPDTLKGLFAALTQHFSGVHLLMDVYTQFGAQMSKLKNPIKEAGVTQTYGGDVPEILPDACELKYIREHSMTPPNLINELQEPDRFVFRKLYAGSFARKIYRLYEYQKG